MKYSYNYPRPLVSTDCVIFRRKPDRHEVLLIRRGKPPFKDHWAFPGGFIEMDEKLVESAQRELREETGLTGIKLKQFHAFGDPGRDPRDRVITVAFYGFAETGKSEVLGMDDAAEAKWFDIKDVPPLAFDHDKMLKIAIALLND